MFSDMYKVTQTPPSASAPRPQEADTREEIRRHDPDQEKKKHKEHKTSDSAVIFGEDQTEVSVESLATFLPLLLKNHSTKRDFSARNAPAQTMDYSTKSARAAGAYARMAQYSPVPAMQERVRNTREEGAVEESVSTNPALSNAEVQAIHRLQSDVAILRQRGVKIVSINKAGTFLQSLQNAVAAALV